MLIKRALYGLLTFAIMFLAVLALWSFSGSASNVVAETIEGGQADAGLSQPDVSYKSVFIEGESYEQTNPDSPQGVVMDLNKWVINYVADTEPDPAWCDAHPNQKVLYVNQGDLVHYCYRGRNIGTTNLYTHTLTDNKQPEPIFENVDFVMEPNPDGGFYIVSVPFTITEEIVNTADWLAHTEDGTAYHKYSSATVKVLIRFRGYAYQGAAGVNDTPLGGVILQLYGWNEGEEMPETPLQEKTSADDGFFNVLEGETLDYYRLVAVPPEGMVPTGAWSQDGTVQSANTIDWQQPDREAVHDNQFYFDVPTPTPTPTNTPTPTSTPTITPTPTSTPTSTPTPTVTPTPTITPTNPPDIQPILWMPVMFK